MRKPFYAATIDDLDDGDVVNVKCIPCGHEGKLTPLQLRSKVKAQRLKMNSITSDTRIRELKYNLTCWPCAKAGKFHHDYHITVTPINPTPENPSIVQLKEKQFERMRGETEGKYKRRIRNM